MNQFVRLTSAETGGELFLRRDMIAAVCSGYKGVTHVTLINEDIDFEVKESVTETLRLITGEDYEKSPLTVVADCDTMRRRKDKPCRHHKFTQGSGLGNSPSSERPDSKHQSPESDAGLTAANATVELKS